MKRIDELLGIINGINYDGVINEKEINLLTHWVEENSDAENEAIVQAVILLKDILEDGVITDEERDQLFEFLEPYQTNDMDTYRSYFILNGIIEGITSDQIINLEEATNLKKWLSENTELQGREIYDKTRAIIENVLEDDYISEDEQEQLLQTFTNLSSKFKKRSKVDAIKRKIIRQENIGQDIIELIDDKELLEDIHYEAMRELKNILSSYSGVGNQKQTSTVFLSLAIIALLSYDRSFYPHVEEQYSPIYQNYSPQRINSMIRELVARLTPNDIESGGRVINYVMMNALVPQYYLPDFYEFLFDIYRLNFGYTLTDTIFDDLTFVYDGLKDKLSEDTDDLELNVTSKTYKLTKATKCVIQDEERRDAIIHLSKELLEIIEKAYWDDETPELENSYYTQGYTEWQKRLNDAGDAPGKGRSGTKRARWTPVFSFSEGKIWLCPPVHNVHGVDDYSAISIKVYSGDSVIYEDQNPEIYEIIGGYQVRAKDIQISCPLNAIKYVLCEGNRIIYDSQDKLNRQFILFDMNGNEVRNNHFYEGTVYIVHNCDDSELEKVFGTDNYQVSIAQNVDEDTVIYLGDHVISFTEEMKPGIEGEVISRQYLQRQDNYLPLFHEIKSISFESVEDPDNVGIQINNKRYRMSEMQFVQRTRGTLNHYQVELDISEPGVYDIAAFNVREGKTLKNAEFSIALDPGFEIEALQIDDNRYLIDVKSGLVESSSFELDLPDAVALTLTEKGGQDMNRLVIDAGIAAYKVDLHGWHSFNEPLWIEDIKSTSQIDIRGGDYQLIRIKDKYGGILDEIPLQEHRGTYSCQIGALVSYKAEHDYVQLELQGPVSVAKRVNCYNKCLLDWNNTHVYNDPASDAIRINASFLGKGTVGYRIVNSDGSTILENDNINTSRPLVIRKLRPLTPFFMQFYEAAKGFTLNKERELGTLPLCSFSFEDLIGIKALIPRVEYEQYSMTDKVLERNEWDLTRTYVKIAKYLGEGIFEGRILRKRDGKFWKVSGAEEVEIEYLGEPMAFTMEAAITFEGDGLLLDFNRNTIHMDYDNPNAIDIYSYTIDLKGTDNE